MRERLILSAILIVCGALTGLAAADGARRRLRLLGRLTEAVRLLRVRMLERAEPLRSALERTEEATFGEIARAMDDLTDASAAWRRVREKLTRRGGTLDCLTESDLAALTELFDGLGRSGRAEQRLLLDAALEALKHAQTDARSQMERANRLYPSVGLLVAATAVVLLL